jgi:ABC-type Zn uptake system ZnuABC Zn-binding protein ZnuA
MLDPSNAKAYDANCASFLDRIDRAMFGSTLDGKYGGEKLWAWHNEGSLRKRLNDDGVGKDLGGWLAKMIERQGAPIITYHRSLSYLANRFGFKVIDELEPKPGLEPTPGHLASVIRQATDQRVRVIIQESFYSTKHAQLVASRCGAKVVVIPLSVGHTPGAKDYISLFDEIVRQMDGAFD